jgi:O-antigen ligase
VTLIRYITFLGMPKDSSAVASLTADDISNIERGFANPLYARPASPRAKAYELAWQLDRALKGANPSGHSVTQRLEFYRAAAGIIKKHPWFGTGTGDIMNALVDEYNRNNTPLTKEFRLLAHNQYLAFAITFGIPGMIIALALMLIPWLRSPNRSFYPFVLFISVFFLLMFNDDSFHSFPVAAFFSYFYTFLLLFENRHET